MSEISFEDILSHYYIKIKQIYDELDIINIQVKGCSDIANSSWCGKSGKVFQEKIDKLFDEINNAKQETANSLKQLSAVAEAL